MLQSAADKKMTSRLPLVDAFRAVAASVVVWHHLALYCPLAYWAVSDPARLDWLKNLRLAVPVFFIIGGYVMARSMSPRTWTARQVGKFLIRRYCRLCLPYLAAIALAMAAAWMARDWMPTSVIGHPPTAAQVLAHAFLLQDILGYEPLSAGLWFVCIDFQLGIIYVLLLYVRDLLPRWRVIDPGNDTMDLSLLMGAVLAVGSLFYFGVDAHFDAWAVYFFGQYFLGVMAYYALADSKRQGLLWAYVAVVCAALAFSWRWRLAISLAAGLLLFLGGRLGLMGRWPASRAVAYLGRTSYSLFLIHFPVIVVVSIVWLWLDWTLQAQSAAGLLAAYVACLLASHGFYIAIERPSLELSRRAA